MSGKEKVRNKKQRNKKKYNGRLKSNLLIHTLSVNVIQTLQLKYKECQNG